METGIEVDIKIKVEAHLATKITTTDNKDKSVLPATVISIKAVTQRVLQEARPVTNVDSKITLL